MPNRVIRESILDSERYWSVPIEARELYRHLQLLADDLGCVSLAPVLIRRRCFNSAPPQTTINSLLQLLADAELIHIYEADGAKYGYIPRFNQRLRRMWLRHPKPPLEFYKNDPEALEKFSKIKGNRVNLSDTCLTDDRHVTAESNLNQSIRGVDSFKPNQGDLKKLLKKNIPKAETKPESVERNRRIAELAAAGLLDEARELRDSAKP